MALSLCGQSVANVGELNCDVSKGVLKKVLIFNGAIQSADYASEAALAAKITANAKLSKSAADKVFPSKEVQEITNNAEANTEGTLGLGFKTIIREGRPAYTVKFFGGANLLKRLRKFNNQTIRILELDANNRIWGTKSGTNFIGFSAKIFFSGGNVATGQGVEEGIIEATISVESVSEYKDNAYFADFSGNPEDIKGLLDVTMANVSNVSNVYKVSVKIPGSDLLGDYSIGSEYGTAIAALSANFSAKTGATYATPMAITSIAYDSALDALTVTYDSTTYSGLASNTPIKLIPPTPAQLDGGSVVGVELLELTFVKP